MVLRILLILVGMAHVANGAFMVVAPTAWYAAVPGVSEAGPLNMHFIVDVGLVYLASGVGFLLGTRPGAANAAFAAAGATWPALHALFHVWGWIMHGFPSALDNALSQVFGVVALAALGVVVARMRITSRD